MPLLPAAHADHYRPSFPTGNFGPSTTLSPIPSFDPPGDEGVYGIGDVITIHLYFAVNIDYQNELPHMLLALETGDVDRFATFGGRTGWNIIYKYTVQPGDYSDDLDYKASNSMHCGRLDAPRNVDRFGLNIFEINCWMSTPGTADYRGRPSLALTGNVTVDGIVPRVANVTTASGAYGTGSQFNVTVNFDEPVYVWDAPPSLVLALDGENRTIPYLDGNETSSLVFNYTVREGNLADALEYAGTGALATDGRLTDIADNNASLVLPEPGGPGSLGATSSVSITAIRGAVAEVDSPLPGGTYHAGHRIEVVVTFNEPVVYGAAPPSLVLDVGGASRTAEYASGNDTRSYVFHYTVQPDDADADGLAYARTALQAAGAGGLRDRAGDAVGTALTTHGAGGPLSHIRIGTPATAYVTGVDSPGGDSAYVLDDTVAIAVEFSAPVTVTGAPALALATDPPRNASYAGGSGTGILEFRYTVERGDAVPGLDYAGRLALSLAGNAAINVDAQDGGGPAALLTLPVPGSPGSLGHTRDIVIDGSAPSVLRVDSPNPNGTHGTGRIVDIAVTFDEPVVVKGSPALALATNPPRNASYAGGSGTSTLEFLYAVQPGDSAPRLGYAGDDALALSGGAAAIRDPAGNAANLTLPVPGQNGSLAASSDIEVHGADVPVLAEADSILGNASGSRGVAAFELGGRTYAAVASGGGNGVQLLRVHDDGSLSVADWIDDTPSRHLRSAYSVDVLTVGGNTYIVSTSSVEQGVQVIGVNSTGGLSNVTRASGSSPDFALGGPRGVASFDAGDSTYVIVTSAGPNSGVEVIRVNASGGLEQNQWIPNTGQVILSGASGVDVFEMPVNRTHTAAYAIVAAGQDDDGVQLFRINDNNGTLTPTRSLGDNSTLELAGATGVDAFRTENNRTYAIVASRDDDGVQLVRVHENGTLEAAGWLRDRDDLALDGAHAVKAFSMGSRTYAAVASNDNDGVQLVRVHEEDGTLSAVGTAGDGPGFPRLDGARGIDVLEAGNHTYAIVTSEHDGGVQLIRLSPASATGASASLPGGTAYPEGIPLNITVGFNRPVSVSDPPPSLPLALGKGGPVRTAEYLAGDGTDSLVFNYTVQRGDDTGPGGLRYAGGAGILALRGAVADAQGEGPSNIKIYPRGDVFVELDTGRGPAAASLALPAADRLRNILFDAAAPRVTSVTEVGPRGVPYGEGETVRIAVDFDEPIELLGPAVPPPSLRLALDGGETATALFDRLSGDGRTLYFSYTVGADDAADPLDYGDAAGALSPGGRTIADETGNRADLTLPGAGQGTLGELSGIKVDGIAPRAVSVASDAGGGPHGINATIDVRVTFSEAVNVTGTPMLELALDGESRSVNYSSGTGSRELTFLYTVRDGDETADLTYAGTGALSLDSGGISDLAGNAVIELLPDPAGRIPPQDGSGPIRIDGVGPRVINVTEADPRGAPYGAGKTVRIAVALGERAEASDGFNSSLRLALAEGKTANARYEGLSDDGLTLFFAYAVQPGDAADPLDYDGPRALSVVSGGITDAPGNPVVLDLPGPGEGEPTLAAAGIRIETGQPRVVSVSSADADRTYGVGSEISIAVSFSEDVYVAGSPRISLETGGAGGRASYDSGSGSQELVFVYTVLPGDLAGDLEYAGADALSLSGGTITDKAGNDALLRLPDPGSPGSLGGSKNIAVNATRPPSPGEQAYVVSVLSRDMGGSYYAGSAVNIAVVFSRAVDVTGAPLLALSTEPPRNAVYVAGAPSYELAFRYAVQEGDMAGRLNYAGADALSLNGGAITYGDGGRAASLVLPPVDSARSLRNSGIAVGTAVGAAVGTGTGTGGGTGTPPPPAMPTCSLGLGAPSLAVEASPGDYSKAVQQVVKNAGSAAFVSVELEATPWYIDPSSAAPEPGAPSLPASLTAMSTAGQGGAFAPLPEGGAPAAVAHGLAGGADYPLWLRINLTGHDRVDGTELVQRIAYTAECGLP